MSDVSLVDRCVSATEADHQEPGPGTASSRLVAGWHRLEQGLVRLSDYFNPIFVKETRQALRSRQFTLTFILLLVACCLVTIGGIALIGPRVYYVSGGRSLLGAYFFILSLPLLVVVPFAAFRSLAAEREDNTYDLLSITTLRSRQIIAGKLASVIMQMIVYYSAIMPCLAFTYLLRGVDAPTIGLLLAYTFFGSLALSMIGLLLAALPRQRYGQLLLSVGFIALLLLALFLAQEIAQEMVRWGFRVYLDSDFWAGNLYFGLVYLSTFLLAFLAAAALISFPTENRSTPLRIAMLLQQAALASAFGWSWWTSPDNETIVVFACISGLFWFLMGTMLTGEQPHMSRRVARSLPQSLLGRVFCTWLNPGPSTGLMFVVASLSAVFVLCFVPVLYGSNSSHSPGAYATIVFLFLGWSYLVAYLGVGRLVVASLRQFTQVTMFAGVLLHLLLVLAGSGIPTSVQWMSINLRDEPYSYLQITNPIWTLKYVVGSSPAPEEPVLLLVIPAAAVCALVLNMPGIVRELKRARTPLPTRIVEDEAELHPSPAPAPQSPWDEPAGA